jgi:hypothetical protein
VPSARRKLDVPPPLSGVRPLSVDVNTFRAAVVCAMVDQVLSPRRKFVLTEEALVTPLAPVLKRPTAIVLLALRSALAPPPIVTGDVVVIVRVVGTKEPLACAVVRP